MKLSVYLTADYLHLAYGPDNISHTYLESCVNIVEFQYLVIILPFFKKESMAFDRETLWQCNYMNKSETFLY
jgi:hypothetical protein